jgi:hypothetical protein
MIKFMRARLPRRRVADRMISTGERKHERVISHPGAARTGGAGRRSSGWASSVRTDLSAGR